MIVLLIEPTNFPPLSKTGTAKYPEPVSTSNACSKGLFNCTCATFSEGIINSSIVIRDSFFTSLVVLIDWSPFAHFTKQIRLVKINIHYPHHLLPLFILPYF